MEQVSTLTIGIVAETTQVAEKLAAGTHTVTITDEAGCTATTEVEITENILELTVALEEEASIKCASESSAVLRVEANGGKPPFQYQLEYRQREWRKSHWARRR